MGIMSDFAWNWFCAGHWAGLTQETWEYSGVLGNDSGMTQEYLRDSGRVPDMTVRPYTSYDILVQPRIWLYILMVQTIMVS